MSFSDTVFLFFLVLILFGPKKLPEMARQAGKLLAELRRASNEFRSQIETEITRLEVQQTVPPNPPPHGTVASSSADSPLGNSVDSNPASSNSTPLDPVMESTVPASQEPHV